MTQGRQPIDDLGLQKPSVLERLGITLMLAIAAIVVVCAGALIVTSLVIGDSSLVLE